MDNIKKILNAYPLTPTEIVPVTDRLYKIKSQNYYFALKRAKLSANQVPMFYNVLQTANQHRLSSILPVYMSQSGDILLQQDTDFYYLTPWMSKKESDEPQHELESFYRTIATIHNQTKRKMNLHVESVEYSIQQEKEKISQYRSTLLAYIEQFEQRHYMSPFELRVCMQFRDVDRVLDQLNMWYEHYLEDIKEDKVSYQSLCHGNLRASHKIYQTSETFFLNWEHAYYGNPVNDLATYYYNECKYHDSLLESFIRSFSVYEKYNPLLQSERSLLSIYLLSPINYLSLLDSYVNRNWSLAQPFQIRALEHAYRRLMQGLTIQHHLEQIRQQIIEEQEQQEEDT